MKEKIVELIRAASLRAYENGRLPSDAFPAIEIEEPKIESHGDFSTNVAMVMASLQKTAPRRIAEAIVDHLDDPEGMIAKTEIAGPGFINFFINPACWHPVIPQIHQQDLDFGRGGSLHEAGHRWHPLGGLLPPPGVELLASDPCSTAYGADRLPRAQPAQDLPRWDSHRFISVSWIARCDSL